MRGRTAAVLAVTAALLAAGCTASSEPDDPNAPEPGTLRVLASSELVDMAPVLEDVREKTGIKVRPTYMGTLDAVDLLAKGRAGSSYDALWLSSNDYLRLRADARKKVVSETPVMTSPVAIGVRTATLRRLGWKPEQVTWSQVEQAVQDGKLTYGMTDPARSNSGFSALISVASGLSGAQSALTDADVAKAAPRLKEFFKGQKLTSGSSGWLAAAYGRRGTVDALINYESTLTPMRDLTVIRPRDGVVTADYPLTLLTGASEQARTNYAAIADYLRRPSVQRQIMAKTWRRPAVPDPSLTLAPEFGPKSGNLPELPFPGKLDAADALIGAFGDSLRRPARTIYVLDLSGSMKGERLQGLKTALTGLTGADASLSGQFSRFNGREQVVLLPFSSRPGTATTFELPEADFNPVLAQIRGHVEKLKAEGDTAIYDALLAAYALAGSGGDRFTSIVLLTDGERTAGADLAAFRAKVPQLPRVPVFTVLFGESNTGEMTEVATLTGGRTFDARAAGALPAAFKEIRGYQ